MKLVSTYFGTHLTTESQAPFHVHETDANIVQDLVHEPEVSNQGSHDNTLQTSILIQPDPGLQKQICDYSTAEIRDAARTEYLKKGPCQPYGHDFPCNMFMLDFVIFDGHIT